MKYARVLFWMVLWFAGLGELRGQTGPTLLYSHGDPSAEEQYSLELMNRARTDPPAEGIRLAAATDPYITQAMAMYGISKAALIKAFTNYPPRPPMAFNPKLLRSSRSHSQDMALNGFQGHVSSDGRTFPTRIQAVGYSNAIAMNEAIYAYTRSAYQGHACFLIDWGVSSLGHRNAMLNYSGPVYNEVGIGLVRSSNSRVGPWVLTHDYAQSHESYLVGVVYNDKDRNGFYSVGEGIKGITVHPEAGDYYTVTSTSGGYAIPLKISPQLVRITFSGGPLTNSVSCVAAWNGVNQKIDLETKSNQILSSSPPYLALGPWIRTPDGAYEATLSVESNKRAVLQVSTNLIDWTNLTTNSASNGIITFRTIHEIGSGCEFFRAAILP